MGICWEAPLVVVRDALMLEKDCSYRTSALQKSSEDTMPRSQASYWRADTPCREPYAGHQATALACVLKSYGEASQGLPLEYQF